MTRKIEKLSSVQEVLRQRLDASKGVEHEQEVEHTGCAAQRLLPASRSQGGGWRHAPDWAMSALLDNEELASFCDL